MWELRFTSQAQKDAKQLSACGLKKKAQELLDIVRNNPYQNPPPYEKLIGDISGAYSRPRRHLLTPHQHPASTGLPNPGKRKDCKGSAHVGALPMIRAKSYMGLAVDLRKLLIRLVP